MGRERAAFARPARGGPEAASRVPVSGGGGPPPPAAPPSARCWCSTGCGLARSPRGGPPPSGGCGRERGRHSPQPSHPLPPLPPGLPHALPGTYPNRNGILGNRIYVRAVDPNFAFLNDDHRNLLRLDEVTGGGMVLVKSLGEILAERGKRLAAVSSGRPARCCCSTRGRPKGVGVLINGYWEPGVRVASPGGDQRHGAAALRLPPPPRRRPHRTARRRLDPRACCATTC